MAKGIGIHGNARGKVGNVVGYVMNGRQMWRGYADQVKNPRSTAQMMQRIKAAPAATFYNAFYDLLDHSWQGVQYGNPSRNYFMSLAFSMPSGYPFVAKDDKRAIPGAYPISKGTLGNFGVDGVVAVPNMFGYFRTNIPVGDISYNADSNDFTIAQFLDGLFAGGVVQAGDQLTFMWIDENFVAHYERIVLNAADLADVVEGEYINGNFFIYISGVSLAVIDGLLLWYVGVNPNQTGVNDLGAGVILSRFQNNSWARSSSIFWVAPSVYGQFMSEAALQAALDSYRGVLNTVNSEWYLNQGDKDGQQISGKIQRLYITVGDNMPAPAGNYYYLGLVDAEQNVVGIFTTTGETDGKTINFDGSAGNYSPVQLGAYRVGMSIVKWDAAYLAQLGGETAAPFEQPTPAVDPGQGGND